MRLTAITGDNVALEIEENDTILDVTVDGTELCVKWNDEMPRVCREIFNRPKKTLLVWTENDTTRDMVISEAKVTGGMLEAELLVTEVTEHV